MKKVKLILFFILILALVFLGYFLNSASKTKAQTIVPTSVTGYANFLNLEQGETASPAIFFTGNNGGSTGNISYAVQYNTSTGLTGYGWSPIYGWINFTGNAASVPSFQNDGEATEWANGHISLSGTNGGSTGNMTYSVNFDPTSGQGSGYAWGGNVLGWIDFSYVLVPPTGTPSCSITPAVSSILHGDSVNLYWSGSNVASCVASDGWSGNKPISGNSNVSPSSTTIYKLTCLGTDMTTSTSCSAKVNVEVYPNCNGGNLVPQIAGTNCGIVNCPACEECPAGQVLLPTGNCGTPPPPPNTCTDSQLNDYTTDLTTQISTPVSWPCYCSAHPTSTNPDCVTFCLNNPSSCKKAPHYQEN
ncbi:MAG TPA: hypothetical protein PLO44_01280 [Candidatus Paceibacterota bacterium]|nr:hypothetical protein [Candidatus Paceibacterota bacterium]